MSLKKAFLRNHRQTKYQLNNMKNSCVQRKRIVKIYHSFSQHLNTCLLCFLHLLPTNFLPSSVHPSLLRSSHWFRFSNDALFIHHSSSVEDQIIFSSCSYILLYIYSFFSLGNVFSLSLSAVQLNICFEVCLMRLIWRPSTIFESVLFYYFSQMPSSPLKYFSNTILWYCFIHAQFFTICY